MEVTLQFLMLKQSFMIICSKFTLETKTGSYFMDHWIGLTFDLLARLGAVSSEGECGVNAREETAAKQTLRSRFTCLSFQHFSFYAKKSLDRERAFFLALRVVSLFSCLSRFAPSATRVVIGVSRTFCSTDQEERETNRSLLVG